RRDYAQALRWDRGAAGRGDAQAQQSLGFMYQDGGGVEPGPRQAVQWWRRAAEQGNASAQYNLGVAYHNGDGVAEDYVEASKWALIAVTHASGESQKKYAVLRDALMKMMTASQIDEAQQRAREWAGVSEKKERR